MSRAVDVEFSDFSGRERQNNKEGATPSDVECEEPATSPSRRFSKAIVGLIVTLVVAALAGVAVGIYFAVRAQVGEPPNVTASVAPTGAIVATGVAYTPRLRPSSSCVPITVSFTQDSADACVDAPGYASVAFKYSDLLLLTDVYRSVAAPGGSGVMAAVGAVAVKGNTTFGGSKIAYECAPIGFQGNPASNCGLSEALGGRALIYVERTRVVVPRAPILISRISFIRSGTPFLSGASSEMSSAFGVTTIDFFGQGLNLTACTGTLDGSPWGCMPNSTYINICQSPQALTVSATAVCEERVARVQARTLNLKGLVYTGYGNYTNDVGATLQPSHRHIDDKKKLLVLSPNPQQFWFNATGCYVADTTGNQCTFKTSGAYNYGTEVFNYDSRFMDYAGTTTLRWKMGSGRPSVNVTVDLWIGNSIDATGPAPCLMYMDTTTGYYIGLDRITPVVGQPTGTYWYNTFVNGDARIAEAPFPTQCGTTATKAEWMGAV